LEEIMHSQKIGGARSLLHRYTENEYAYANVLLAVHEVVYERSLTQPVIWADVTERHPMLGDGSPEDEASLRDFFLYAAERGDFKLIRMVPYDWMDTFFTHGEVVQPPILYKKPPAPRYLHIGVNGRKEFKRRIRLLWYFSRGEPFTKNDMRALIGPDRLFKTFLAFDKWLPRVCARGWISGRWVEKVTHRDYVYSWHPEEINRRVINPSLPKVAFIQQAPIVEPKSPDCGSRGKAHQRRWGVYKASNGEDFLALDLEPALVGEGREFSSRKSYRTFVERTRKAGWLMAIRINKHVKAGDKRNRAYKYIWSRKAHQEFGSGPEGGKGRESA
jgi:hypothetical protein